MDDGQWRLTDWQPLTMDMHTQKEPIEEFPLRLNIWL